MNIKPNIEALERRDTPSTVVMGPRGALHVYGTAGDDAIVITQTAANTVVVDGNTYTGVRSVRVFADAGNDLVDASGVTTLRTEQHGEGGDDTLIGGGAGDQLYGGTGNDVLTGNAGDDYLDGNAGDDVYDGGAGLDTAYDFAGGFGSATGVEYLFNYY